jgi:PTS system mannose-specific IIB component
MSIDLVRVDNRLIHGQVLEAWVPFVHARRIVVVDDAAAGDPLQRSILELATPREIRLEIVSIDEAVGMFNHQSFDDGHCLVLFAGPCEAYQAYQRGFRFGALNVGNVHFAAGKTRVSQSVCCDAEELSVLRALAKAGVQVEVRSVPRDASKFITADGDGPAATS